jgi:hypothetical protein
MLPGIAGPCDIVFGGAAVYCIVDMTRRWLREFSLKDDSAKSSVISDRDADQEKTLDPSGPRIRCPRCGWSPRQRDRWSCICGHLWNTFDTGGVCPACLHQWTSTQCLSCERWSPHSDWYAH